MVKINSVRFLNVSNLKIFTLTLRFLCTNKSEPQRINFEEEFEQMPFIPKQYLRQKSSKEIKSRKNTHFSFTSRYKRMPIDQDWNSVWPAARSFNPHTVPFPVYQGLLRTGTRILSRPNKFSNHELMKIPNFLHLTPTNITKQCQAIKKFCNPWPKGLETDEQIEKHFPLEIITYDYCHSSPSIRDPNARVAIIKLNLSHLELDDHAKDKMIRLLGKRYDQKTNTLTIKTDSCPLKKQNTDYALYQLTACYFEAWKIEDWESLKTENDWERFFWSKSEAKAKAITYMKQINPKLKEEDLENHQNLKDYSQALTELYKLENDESLKKYEQSVIKLLFN